VFNSVTKLISGKVRSYIGLSFLSINAVILSVAFIKSLKKREYNMKSPMPASDNMVTKP